jgi:Tol biopolymer transport system component
MFHVTGAAMDSRILYQLSLLTSIAGAVAGCTSGQRSSVAGENKLSEPADKLGLTQLAVAPAVRRVWSGPEIDLEARPSPDGQSFSMTDWNTGNLKLQNVATGTHRPLTSDGSWDIPMAFAYTSIISPDGKSVAYGWWSDKADAYELRIAGLSGADSGKIRTAYTLRHGAFIGAQAWTPDGTEVIAVSSPTTTTNQIVAIHAAGGGLRILRTMDWRYPNNMAVSPDGRWIAYDFPTDGYDRDVYLMGVDGTGNKVVADNTGDDVVMGWTGKDGRLLIASERSGTPSVWSIRLIDGTVTGDPVLVRSNMWRMVPVGTSRNGSIFYTVSTGERGIFTVAIDPSTAAIRSRGTLLTGENENTSPETTFDWSADGDYVAYGVRRGGIYQLSGPQDVMVRAIKRGNVRRLSPRMSRILKLQWFPDGRSMVLVGADDKGEYGVFRMDVANASLKLLLHTEPGRAYPRNLSLSPDGKRILFTTSDASDLLINELEANGGISVVRRVKNATEGRGLTFSPDGRSLAMGLRDQKSGTSRLILMPAGPGPEREILRLDPSEELSYAGLFWTPDARALIFGVRSPSMTDQSADVRSFSLETGKVSSTGLRQPGLISINLSPDGRTLLFGVNHFAVEMWTMEAPVFGPSPAGATAHK